MARAEELPWVGRSLLGLEQGKHCMAGVRGQREEVLAMVLGTGTAAAAVA